MRDLQRRMALLGAPILLAAGCVAGASQEEYDAAVARAERAEFYATKLEVLVTDLESRRPEIMEVRVEVTPEECTEGIIALTEVMTRHQENNHLLLDAASQNRDLTANEFHMIIGNMNRSTEIVEQNRDAVATCMDS